MTQDELAIEDYCLKIETAVSRVHREYIFMDAYQWCRERLNSLLLNGMDATDVLDFQRFISKALGAI